MSDSGEQSVELDVAKFYDSFVDRCISDMLNRNARVERAILYAKDSLNRFLSQRILDLGCGIGWSAAEFSRLKHAPRVLAIDLSSDLIAVSNKLFGDLNSVSFKQANLVSDDWLATLNDDFDACVMLDVYEHISLKDRKNFHHALSQCLSEKAIVVLSCPSYLHQRYLRESERDGLQPVDEDVTPRDILAFASDIGAELLDFKYVSVWHENDYLHATLVRGLVRDVKKGAIKESRSSGLFSIFDRLKRARRLDLHSVKLICDTVEKRNSWRAKIYRILKRFLPL